MSIIGLGADHWTKAQWQTQARSHLVWTWTIIKSSINRSGQHLSSAIILDELGYINQNHANPTRLHILINYNYI